MKEKRKLPAAAERNSESIRERRPRRERKRNLPFTSILLIPFCHHTENTMAILTFPNGKFANLP